MPWFTHPFPIVGHLGSFQITTIKNKAMVNIFLHKGLLCVMNFNFRLLSAPFPLAPLPTPSFNVFLCQMEKRALTFRDCDEGEVRQGVTSKALSWQAWRTPQRSLFSLPACSGESHAHQAGEASESGGSPGVNPATLN